MPPTLVSLIRRSLPRRTVPVSIAVAVSLAILSPAASAETTEPSGTWESASTAPDQGTGGDGAPVRGTSLGSAGGGSTKPESSASDGGEAPVTSAPEPSSAPLPSEAAIDTESSTYAESTSSPPLVEEPALTSPPATRTPPPPAAIRGGTVVIAPIVAKVAAAPPEEAVATPVPLSPSTESGSGGVPTIVFVGLALIALYAVVRGALLLRSRRQQRLYGAMVQRQNREWEAALREVENKQSGGAPEPSPIKVKKLIDNAEIILPEAGPKPSDRH